MQDFPSLARSYFCLWAFFTVYIFFKNWDAWFWFTQILNFNLRIRLFKIFSWLCAFFRRLYWGFGPWRAQLFHWKFLNRRFNLNVDLLLLFKRLLNNLFLEWLGRRFFIFIWIVHIIEEVNLFFLGLRNRSSFTALVQVLSHPAHKIMLLWLWLGLSLRSREIIIWLSETWKSYFLWFFRRTTLNWRHVLHVDRFVLAVKGL